MGAEGFSCSRDVLYGGLGINKLHFLIKNQKRKTFFSAVSRNDIPNGIAEFRIRCLFDPWIRDPGWGKIKIRIRDEHFRSYFRELRNNFFVKILKFIDADAGPGIFLTPDPGRTKIRIQNKHPGSATLWYRGKSRTYATNHRYIRFCDNTSPLL